MMSNSAAYAGLFDLVSIPFAIASHLGSYLRSIYESLAQGRSPPTTSSLETPASSRIWLVKPASAIVKLPDGRALGYAQYGSLTGRPIIYCHGLPGSRVEGGHFQRIGEKLGVRIIAVDRPGVGCSSPMPGARILDHAKDIDYLAKHLEIDEFGVVGISGGGPYALACATALPPEKLRVVGIMCGLGPPDIGTAGMNWWNWLGFTIGFRYMPFIVRWYFKYDIAGRLDLPLEQRLEKFKKQFMNSQPHQKDREAMADDDFPRMFLRSAEEAFGQGTDGYVQDGQLVCNDFGFRVQDIRKDLPFQLWYGKLDTNVPLAYGEHIAARLGDQAQLTVRDETHSSLFVNCKDDFLRDIVGKF